MKERTIFITDAHGCIAELKELILKIQPKEKYDRFIVLGDLVDKGPDSIGVLEYVFSLTKKYNESLVVLGNHDKKWRRRIGTPTQHPDLTPQLEVFLKSFKLFYRVPEVNIFAVHGGIYSGIYDELGGYIDDDDAEFPHKNNRRGEKVEKLAHTRHVTSKGRFVSFGKEEPGDRFWADVYDGSEGFVFYGHNPFDYPKVTQWSCGLDTGCCYGNRLTAAIIRHKTFECNPDNIELVSVKAKKVYKQRRVDQEA